MKKTIIFLSINLLIAVSFVSSNVQLKTLLRFDESAKSFAGKTLFCDKDYNCGLYQNEKSKTSKIDELEILIKVSRKGKNFHLLIDTNQNNKLTDEKKVLLENGSKTKVKISKKLESGKNLFLPFEVSHQISKKDGLVIDKFNITQHYAATGTLIYKNCSSKISLLDMNYDGEFSLSDAERGTNFQIDKNTDGKFWGAEEYKKTNEIIEFCGQNFLVSSLDDISMTLMPTDLQLAKVGEVVPKFSIVLLNGETLSSDNLKGKHYVLDFWASWCAPCVENLPQINSLKNEFKNRLSVFSVNVDESSRKDLVEKIVSENRLFDFSAVRGLGNDDPLWKTFGGINLNNLSIPLYVFVDKDGIVRYADNGGKDLSDLKSKIKEFLPEL